MDRDKQIEEIKNVLIHTCKRIRTREDDIMQDYYAKALYNAGYRKSSEVTREIFEEIEENLNNLIKYYKEKSKYVTEIEYSEFEEMYCDIKIRTFEGRLLKIAELKKKYIGKDTNVTTNTEDGK